MDMLMRTDLIELHKRDTDRRKEMGDPCVHPRPCPSDWLKRKPYPKPEGLAVDTPLSELAKAVVGFDEGTCIKALCLLGDRADAESLEILRTIGQDRPLFIPNGDAVIPSQWMVRVAKDVFLDRPGALEGLLEKIQAADSTWRDVRLAGQKRDGEGRLDPSVESVLTHVARQGFRQSWVRKEGASTTDFWYEPDPGGSTFYSEGVVAQAVLDLGRGKTRESMEVLRDFFGDSELFAKVTRWALDVRKDWDEQAADLVIEERKKQDPVSVLHFCTIQEARDYVRNSHEVVEFMKYLEARDEFLRAKDPSNRFSDQYWEASAYAKDNEDTRRRKALEDKYAGAIFRAHKAELARKAAEEKAAAKTEIEQLKANREWFLGPIGYTGEYLSFFGKVQLKPLWMRWLHEHLEGFSSFWFWWVGMVLCVFSLHTIPVMRIFDRLWNRFHMTRMEYMRCYGKSSVWSMFGGTTEHAEGRWFADKSLGWGSGLSRKPHLATLVAIPAFLITSPLMAISVPYTMYRFGFFRPLKIFIPSFDYDTAQDRRNSRYELAYTILKWGCIAMGTSVVLGIGFVVWKLFKPF